MSTRAYVLTNVEIGREDEIAAKLREVPEIKRVSIVYGVYDLVVEVETEWATQIKDIVNWKIYKLPGVKSTLTMIAYGEKP